MLKPLVWGQGIAADAIQTAATKRGTLRHTQATPTAKLMTTRNRLSLVHRLRTAVDLKKERKVKVEPLKRERHTSTPRAASVPVKHAARTPAPTLKPEPASPEKKISLYEGVEDSDSNFFKSKSSPDVPLAVSLAALRGASRAMLVLSSLHEDEDVPMPPAAAMPAAAPISPTVSSVSSLSTTSATPSAFSSISGALRATSSAAGPSALGRAPVSAGSPATHMLFNWKTLVLYDDPKATVAERKPGELMEVVEAGEIWSWISTLGRSANMLKAAVEERNPSKSMQVVEGKEVVEWISTLGDLGK
ncbi:hypothetical protein K438DRAFT_1959348 [Mycena galopus ATCC 62051]|nr:hypothetical protein K438DRAFT_1959348 [Mycena galopus ATCC 62051]